MDVTNPLYHEVTDSLWLSSKFSDRQKNRSQNWRDCLNQLSFGGYLYNGLHTIKSDIINLTDDTLPSMMLVNGIKYNMSSVRRAQISLLSSTDEAEIAEDIRWMNDH